MTCYYYGRGFVENEVRGSENSVNFHGSIDNSSDGVAEITCEDNVDIHMGASRYRSTDFEDMCRNVDHKMGVVTSSH